MRAAAILSTRFPISRYREWKGIVDRKRMSRFKVSKYKNSVLLPVKKEVCVRLASVFHFAVNTDYWSDNFLYQFFDLIWLYLQL